MNKQSFGMRLGFDNSNRFSQLNDLDTETRIDLYNAYFEYVYEPFDSLFDNHWIKPEVQRLIWRDVLKKPLDENPSRPAFLQIFKNFLVSSGSWYKVYETFEYILDESQSQKDFPVDTESLISCINKVMTKNNTGYKIYGNQFVPITNHTEIEEINSLSERLTKLNLKGAEEHLDTALTLIALKPEPDLRNSIKESISIVGAIARLIQPENDLAKSLYVLEKKKVISTSLAGKFKSFYSYTSGKEGIRHELMDEPNLKLAEARYFLVACSAFANYLLDQASTNGLFAQVPKQ